MKMRKADFQDVENVYLLFIDKTVRAMAKSSDVVSFKDHKTWFNSRIPQDDFFILEEENGAFMGQIRIDEKNNENVMSIEIVGRYRNKGYATKAVKNCLQLTNKNNIIAYIKNNNIPSIKLFQKAGFVRLSKWGGGGYPFRQDFDKY
ncbi:MAG: GNAT family N-acetyltransferase, partial [Holosporaceae bacterium]|nr:GNAT family N-acetyltransferase [Holosporaceae bacterium]